MKWRCLNDVMRYCNDKPECETQPNVVKSRIDTGFVFFGGTCKLDPKTCGKH